jgi:hypothetical protein
MIQDWGNQADIFGLFKEAARGLGKQSAAFDDAPG